MSNAIIIERFNGIAVVRFNRPESRNPLSINVLKELHKFVDAASVDKTLKALIFTGRDGVFASGADLREIDRVTPDGALEFALRGQTLMGRIASLSVPAIAAINGLCFGGALDLALACRRRIASPNAEFAHPGSSLGIITGWGGTQRLPRLVGQGIALEMLFTARRVSASEALKIGLIDEIAADPLAAAMDYAR